MILQNNAVFKRANICTKNNIQISLGVFCWHYHNTQRKMMRAQSWVSSNQKYDNLDISESSERKIIFCWDQNILFRPQRKYASLIIYIPNKMLLYNCFHFLIFFFVQFFFNSTNFQYLIAPNLFSPSILITFSGIKNIVLT